MTAQTQSFLQGEVVDERYRLGQYLGGSDHSAVFLTEFGNFHPKNAAIKLLPARRGSAEVQLSRWRLVANLAQPHLLRILDMGRCEVGSTPTLYVVTELASENLAEIIPERPLTPEEGREMLTPILDVLSLIHSRGFVHGRVKPSNILVVGEEIKLSSESICRLSDPVENAGAPSVYDPPEGTRNGASPAGDIWSLGVTIVEALSQEVLHWEPASRREPAIPETVPPPFAEFARHCLRRDPKNRWTAANIRARLPRARVQVPDRVQEPLPERIEEHPAARPVEGAPESLPETRHREPDRQVEVVPGRAPALTARIAPALAATSQAVLHWLSVALDASQRVAAVVWHRLKRIEWRRYAASGWQHALAAWRSLPTDALRRHAAAQWRRYALGAGVIVSVLLLILAASKLGGPHPATQQPQVASTSVPSQPAPAKPATRASRRAASGPPARSSQPSVPAVKEQRQQPQQQPTTPTLSAAPSAAPFNPPPAPSAGEVARGSVLHQVMPDIPKKASDTIWGTVRVGVRVSVDAAGNVTSASLDSVGPSRYFARLSLDAARDWKFAPPQMNGAGVPSTWTLQFGYRKDGASVQPLQVQP